MPEEFNIGNLQDLMMQASDPQSVSVVSLPLSEIIPDEGQVRKEGNDGFSEETLSELADSIRENGVLQPITVRRKPEGGYVILMGERRYRASLLAGRVSIPAIISSEKEMSKSTVLIQQVVENIQRAELDPLEQASAVAELIESGYSQMDLVSKLGLSKSRISMLNSVASIPDELLSLYRQGRIAHELRFLYDLCGLYRRDPEAVMNRISELLRDSDCLSGRSCIEMIRDALYKPEPPVSPLPDPEDDDSEDTEELSEQESAGDELVTEEEHGQTAVIPHGTDGTGESPESQSENDGESDEFLQEEPAGEGDEDDGEDLRFGETSAAEDVPESAEADSSEMAEPDRAEPIRSFAVCYHDTEYEIVMVKLEDPSRVLLRDPCGEECEAGLAEIEFLHVI